ncbi:MAG: tetratricopeptide repeat protein [Woeseiaceae bacterium]|jgi:TolB-like protein
MSLFGELQRRNVFRVTVAYVVSAWLLAQVADLVLDNIAAPDWVMQTILLVLLLGLAPVVFFSWAYEVTPDGVKRESEVDRSQSITHVTGRKLDRTITFVLVLAVAYFAVDKFVLSSSQTVATPADTGEITAEAATAGNTIAVLPFVNMSGDEENEYFSDGLSEELLNVLAKNPALQVAARTSSFSLKGEKIEIGEIGRRLNVEHVLEGSVRKSGDQVRITAQLIRVENGFHLWSDTYDRNLDNIFAVQDEIAAKITAALVPQIVGESGTPASSPASSGYEPSAQAYQQYLLAREYFNKRTATSIDSAYELLKVLVREHSDYAEAQALYAHATLLNSARMSGDIPWIVAEAQVRRLLEKASSLKPDLPEIYLVEGRLHARSRDPKAAIPFFERAIELNPSYAEAYRHLSEAAMHLGQTDKAWQALETALKLDPISVSTLTWVIDEATDHGRSAMADDAIQVLRQVAPASADWRHFANLFQSKRVAEAAIALEDYRATWPDEDPDDHRLAILYANLGKTDEALALDSGATPYIAAGLGQRETALSLMEEEAARHTDPHDRADVYWVTYVNLGMYDEALEVLSDLWYGYAAEDIGPRMDVGDVFVYVELLRHAGRADEAAPIAQELIEMIPVHEAGWTAFALMLEGKHEAALDLFIEQTKAGNPPLGYIGVRANYFALKDLPEFTTLERLIEEFREEQRALYEELTAARTSAEDTAHP